jgi:enoyl-CoA hydratase
MNSTTVQIRYENEIAILELDDGKANVLGHDSIASLMEKLDEVKDAGAVVISGRPGKFSAGFDLAVMKSGEDAAREMLRSGVELFLKCYSFPRPVVAACTGHALAAGAILLMSCDLRVGAKGEYKIGLPELAMGMSLPLFATELAKDRISKRHFTKATALGQTYNPEGACDAGFLDEIVDPDEVLSTSLARAESLKSIGKTQLTLTRSTARGETIKKINDTLEEDLSLFMVSQ